MAEKEVHPGSFVGDSIEEFKKLPTGGKIVAGVALLGVIGIAIYERSKAGATTAPTSGSTSGVNATGATSGQQGAMIGNVPVVPPNYTSLYNPTTGSLEGYQPIAQGPVPPPSQNLSQGSVFLGPTGVRHYVATGNQSLSQIAQAQGLSSWNSIYAIPQNQRAFGALNSKQAASYVPPAGSYVVLPQVNTARGGGPDSTPSIVQHAGSNGATQVPSSRMAGSTTNQTGVNVQGGQYNGDSHRNRTVREMLG